MSSPTKRPFSGASGNLPEEAREWLAEHPEENSEGLEEVWLLAEHAFPVGAASLLDEGQATAIRERLLTRIASMPDTRGRTRVNSLRSGRIWAVAASILLAMAIGTIVLLIPVTVTAPSGGLHKVALSDGSEVLLNSRSTLKYRRTFGWWGRSVELEGEAFFDVDSGTDPFQVNTFNSTVTVVGTHFNVRAWPKDAALETRVILTEGTVSLCERGAPESAVVLHEGQMSRVTGDNVPPSEPVEVDAERLVIWRTGGLAFFDTTVDVVLADVERRFGAEIETSPEIRARRLSLFMSAVPDPEAVLEVLANMHGLKWSKQGNTYQLVDGAPVGARPDDYQ